MSEDERILSVKKSRALALWALQEKCEGRERARKALISLYRFRSWNSNIYMYGETFYYSSPGPENIQSLLKGLGFTTLAWEVDSVEANGYMIALMGKG